MTGQSKKLFETITFWTLNLISLLHQSIFNYILSSFQEIQFLRSSLDFLLLHAKNSNMLITESVTPQMCIGKPLLSDFS